MILVMRNLSNEFLPGHDWTAVRLDGETIGLAKRRAMAAAALRRADGSAAELRYWDASAWCVASPDPLTAEDVERALDDGDGWAVMGDGALGSFERGETDCCQMIVSAGDPPSVAWAYRVGSEPIRTVEVPLDAVSRRLGPLGRPLRDIP